MKKKRMESRKIFAPISKTALSLCVLSLVLGVGSSIFLYEKDTSATERNSAQQIEFSSSRAVIDKVDAQFVSQFAAFGEDAIKTKMAQRGHVVLLENTQLETLYGYTEIERILTNKTSEIKDTGDSKKYNFPSIKLISFVFEKNGSRCTTLVQFLEVGKTVQNQVWKWEKGKNGWVSKSLPATYTAKDVEITKDGISFMLVPKENPQISNLYVLNNSTKLTQKDIRNVEVKIISSNDVQE